MKDNHAKQQFDDFSEDYDCALNKGIAISGEDKNYFAKKRVEWLAHCLKNIKVYPKKVLDYGCGTGTAVDFLLKIESVIDFVGIDVSAKSLEIALQKHPQKNVKFYLPDNFTENNIFELAFCNGVFHHIPVEQRSQAIGFINTSLKSGGIFSFWENNPWNPGTRIVMNRIPFDRDAITLNFIQAKNLIKNAGFEILQTDFIFYFPRSMAYFRFLEKYFIKIPLGAQYQILAKKIE